MVLWMRFIIFFLFLKTRGEIGAYLAEKEVMIVPRHCKSVWFESSKHFHDRRRTRYFRSAGKMETLSEKGILYTIPWYDNPSGLLHSEQNMKALSEVAKHNEWFVVRDGAYVELSYFEPVAPLPVEDHVLKHFRGRKQSMRRVIQAVLLFLSAMLMIFFFFLSSWRLSPVLPTQAVAFQLIQKVAHGIAICKKSFFPMDENE